MSESTQQPPSTRQSLTLIVPGMESNHCAGIVRNSLERLTGVEKLETRVSDHQVHVTFDNTDLSPETLRQAVEKASYEVADLQVAEQQDASDESATADAEAAHLAAAKKRLWLAIPPTVIIMLLMAVQVPLGIMPENLYLAIIAILAFPVVFIAGRTTHRSARRSILNRTPNMDALISLGSLPPYLIGLVGFIYPMTSLIEMASTIMSFHLLGRYLEALAKGQALKGIRNLLSMGAKTARVRREDQQMEVPVQSLRVGDVMIVHPGEKVPTDGEIITGNSHLDESIATGESVPVEKHPGDRAIGATINQEGLLEIRATKVGRDTFLSQVIQLVKQAQASQVPIQGVVDRITNYFVPIVFVIALITLVAWWLFPEQLRPILVWGEPFLPWVDPDTNRWLLGIVASIAVMVIACPCALGLATPMVLMVSSGLGANRGILIRDGRAIQTLKNVDTVVFEKTGILTQGEPKLTDVILCNRNFSQAQVLGCAASVEAGSAHPLAKAILEGARDRAVEVPPLQALESVTARGMQGYIGNQIVRVGSYGWFEELGFDTDQVVNELEQLEQQGKTAILVGIAEFLVGLIAVADTLKPDSAEAIKALKEQGMASVMVTGDNEQTANAIAAEIGIDRVLANVVPEGKIDAIRHLQSGGSQVAMVGDGINDAAALKQADVAIAIGAGVDVAIETADVVLVSGELSKVVEAIELSRATFRKIVQNLLWASIYNLAAIAIAAIGLLHPAIGVIAMTASSLSVIGNAMLLKRISL